MPKTRNILGTAALAWAADPVEGTWKLNVSKSKFSPGPAPKESTRVYEAHPEGIKVTVRTIEADGHAFTILITANYDGKDYPVVGSPDYDAVELKKVNERTSEAKLLHGHDVIATFTREVSADGKTNDDHSRRRIRNIRSRRRVQHPGFGSETLS